MSSVVARFVRRVDGLALAAEYATKPEQRSEFAPAELRRIRRAYRMGQVARGRAFNAPPIGLDANDARKVKNALKTVRRSWGVR